MNVRLGALCAVLLLQIVLSGCSALSTTRQTEDPAGELLILGSPEEQYVRGMARAFQLETGITTNFVRLSSGQALDAIRADAAAPKYSLWWGGPSDLYITAAGEGLLEPYRPRGSGKIPHQYKDAEGDWTGVYVGALGFAVNTRVLAEKGLPEPASWSDLTNPIYRGQISVAHPATSGTAFTMLSTIVQLNNRDMDRGFAYIEALGKNVRNFERSGAEPARIAGRGDAAIAIAFSHDIVATIEGGATNLKLVFPQEGTGFEIGGMALLKGAPNPTAAKRFMDWALTERAQELGPLFAAYQIPTNPDAKVPKQSVRLSAIKTIDYDFEWAGEHRTALVERFNTSIAPPPTQASAGATR
jgi:iron(III) transport system substrate-binding protein